MKQEISGNKQVTPLAQEAYTTGSVISRDGTTIGYRQYGHGPGLVLVQGAMGSAQNFKQLAGKLADMFTVYVPDRRGRGLSDLPYSKDYTIQKDVEDLDALLSKTGTHQVFGLSSGALISLQAAFTLPAIHKVAVYEPPLFSQGAPIALWPRFEREIAQGKLAEALITAMKATQMGPSIFNIIPHFLLAPLTNMMLKGEEKNGSGDYLPMKVLALALQYDFQLVAEMRGTQERFRKLSTPVLLLGGSKSPAYLKADLDVLEKILPRATRIEFPGLGHGAAWNYDKQRNPEGQPEPVARELRRFFAS